MKDLIYKSCMTLKRNPPTKEKTILEAGDESLSEVKINDPKNISNTSI